MQFHKENGSHSYDRSSARDITMEFAGFKTSHQQVSFNEGSEAAGRHPIERMSRLRQRVILATDPALVTNLVQMLKQKIKSDFTSSGLVTARKVGYLDVKNVTEMFFNRTCQVSFHNLHMIDVILHKYILRSDRGDQIQCLNRLIREESWNVV